MQHHSPATDTTPHLLPQIRFTFSQCLVLSFVIISMSKRVCLVTGASSGIGRAFAARLSSEGYQVALVGRRRDALQRVKDSLAGNEADSLVQVCDVSNIESCQAAIDATIETFGKLDILVNCAGCMYFTLMKSQKHNDWHKMINTNCTGVVNMCGLVVPHFLASEEEKHIINISSDAGRQVFPCLAVYNASKSFVQVFTKSLRCELVNTNVRVTDLQPGDVRTNLVMENSDAEALSKVGVSGGELVGGNDMDLSSPTNRSSVLDPDDVVDAGMFAINCKRHIGVHEMVIEPRNQLFGDPTSV